MLTITVLSSQSWEPLVAQVVMIDFRPPYGGWALPEKTDVAGVAKFKVPPGVVKVYINGESVYEGFLEGQATFYLQVPSRSVPMIPYWWYRLYDGATWARPQVRKEDEEAPSEVRRSLPPAAA